MPQEIARKVSENQSPSILLRFPRLIRYQYLASWLLTERLWVIRKHARKKMANLKEGSRVLELGCGTGVLTSDLAAAFPGKRFVGCDKSEEAIKTGELNARIRRLSQLSFMCCDLMDLERGEGYDLIASASLLQYVPDIDLAFRHIHGLMKPDGKWIIYQAVESKRFFGWYTYLYKKWLSTVTYDYYHESKYLTSKELIQALVRNGFSIDENYYVYGRAGKIAYELLSFGQFSFMKLPWILAILFALVFFPLILLPAWILMATDLAMVHQTGNGLLLVVSRK